ncbi:TPA: hypothetical protein HA336_00990 [Methanopyrus kandleri]|uniref:Uncharacterized protein n=1 Tax=Methanopyrus kandleri TaxID=2320 RepID=A0A832ST08_9EURY|nr:hypothetical protein [Methanopyrus kandleri]
MDVGRDVRLFLAGFAAMMVTATLAAVYTVLHAPPQRVAGLAGSDIVCILRPR